MTPEERVLEAYYERLTVFPVDKSRVISIEFQSADPELAARGRQRDRRELSRAAADRAAGPDARRRPAGSRGEIEVLRKQVAEAEAKVEEFRSKTNLFIGTNNTTLSNQQLGESNSRSRGRALAEGRARSRRRSSSATCSSAAAPVESADVINSELIRRLNEQRVTLRAQLAEQSSTLLDNHPRIKELKAQIADLDRQIRDEAARLARSLENDAQHRRRAGRVAERGLDQLKQQAASTNGQDVRAARARARGQGAARPAGILSRQVSRGDRARQPRRRAGRCAHHLARGRVEHAVFPEEAADRADRDARDAVHLGRLHHHRRAAGRQRLSRRAALAVVRAAALSRSPRRGRREPRPKPAAPAAKRSWLPKGFIRAKADSRRSRAAAADASSAPAPAASELTIDDLAQALREAGEGGKRVAVVGAAAGIGTTHDRGRARARRSRSDARVVLVDLALDRPKLAAITTDPRAPGIADLVRGTASFGQIITRDRFSRVQVDRRPAGSELDAPRRSSCSERLTIAIDALSRSLRSCRHRCRRRAACVPADRIARLAPCAVLVASGLAAASRDAMRDHLANAGFSDIAVFTGTAPALDAESMRSVAA